ncbi:MAG: trypsin-like peptidase domain-containing protein [Balneolaceae bacterium]
MNRRRSGLYLLAGLLLAFLVIPELSYSQHRASELIQSQRDLVERVNQSVVQIVVDEFGRPSRFEQSGNVIFTHNVRNGSGVIVDSDGYIITNRHVVDGAQTVQVLLPERENVGHDESILNPRGIMLLAEVVGVDRETDIAVLKVDATGLPTLPFGDSEEIRAGDFVFAFGSPLGLQQSVSMGIVSAKARQLREEDPMIYIQTDAPINPGNSGGPLVNVQGEVIGINTLNLSQSGGSEGLGFAAPSHIVESIYRQIRERGSVSRGVLGTYAQTVTPRLAQAMNLQQHHRVVLGDVFPGTPADFAGLQPGDVVMALDGRPMENARQLNVNIYGRDIDSRVTLTVYRNGETMDVPVRVMERPDREAEFMNLVDMERNFIAKIGVLAIGLTSDIRDMLPPLRKRGGILVAASNGKSTAMGDELQPGDVIYTVNGEDMFSYDAFYSVFEHFTAGDFIVMQIQRGNRLMYVSHRLID